MALREYTPEEVREIEKLVRSSVNGQGCDIDRANTLRKINPDEYANIGGRVRTDERDKFARFG